MNKNAKLVSGILAGVMLAGTGSMAYADTTVTTTQSTNGQVQVLLQFDDLKDAQWALRYIANMQAQDVFVGYPDGTFKPNQPINRLQAVITAVRLMGLEDEAKAKSNVTLQFKDAAQIDKDYAWAKGYIAVAAEHGLFGTNEDTFQADQNASRLWVSILLVRALGLESQALAQMNTTLPFTDENSIPAGAVGYVAVALKQGIVVGYPDNTFHPNDPVTRAEMATFLARTDDSLPDDIKQKKNKNDHHEYEGTVTAVNGSKVTIADKHEGSVTLDLSDKIIVFHAKGRGSVSDIQVGDQIDIRVKHGRAVLVEIKREAQEIEGKIVSIGTTVAGDVYQPTVSQNVYGPVTPLTLQTEDNQQVTVYITSNTKIKIDNVDNAKISDMKVGDQAVVKLFGNQALEIKIEREDQESNHTGDHRPDNHGEHGKIEAEGQVVATTTNSITVNEGHEGTNTYLVSNNVSVEYAGHASAKVTDLATGLHVELEGKNGYINKIEVK